MNRIEFMAELSRLLEGIPEEDRLDALNYYNDYFDDAGSENEQNVIEELESPEKVAMKIKAERGDIEVVKSSGVSALDEVLVEKISTWRFNPATDSNGNPVASSKTEYIDFRN